MATAPKQPIWPRLWTAIKVLTVAGSWVLSSRLFWVMFVWWIAVPLWRHFRAERP